MKKNLRKKTLIVSLIAFLIFLNTQGCKPLNPFTYNKITDRVTINTHVKEFVFDKPFRPVKQINTICFEYLDKISFVEISKPPEFSDGTPLIITSYIVDNAGKKYELSDFAWNTEKSQCVYLKFKVENPDMYKKDVTFTKLYVSSNRRFTLSKIEWKSYNAWDMK